MAATQEQICNRALLRFGNLTIDSIDDETPEAQACSALWDQIVEEMLALYPWNFAMVRSRTALTADPNYTQGDGDEFEYRYEKPNGCLVPWDFYGSTATWVLEGDYIYTDEETVYLRYISLQDDPAKWPPWFAACVSTRLAADLAPKLSANKGLKAEIMKELNAELLDAFARDAMVGNSPRAEGEKTLDNSSFSWQTEGR